MSWNVLEWSIFNGRPVELFRFVYGITSFLYTSSDEDVAYQNQNYKAVPITRSKVGIAYDISKSDITVTVPRDNRLAALYVGPPPDDVVNLTIYSYHKGDSEFVVLWQGRVTGATFADSEVNITCEPVFTSLRRPGLRAMYQGLCRHELYSAACGATSDAYKYETQVSGYNGVNLSMTLATLPYGHLAGGLLVTNNGIKRWILEQNGANLVLNNTIPGLIVGEAITVFAGCDQSQSTCWSKFNNGLNFGGFPYIPNKNPFIGDPII